MNNTALDKTFKECYSKILRNPHTIDVKDHYKDIIKTYVKNLRPLINRTVKVWYNDSNWKWSEALDGGKYYEAENIDSLIICLMNLPPEEIEPFICSKDMLWEKQKTGKRFNWNEYYSKSLEVTDLKNQLRKKDETIKKLRECVFKIKTKGWHNNTCSYALNKDYSCDCHKSLADQCLKEVEK